MAQIDDLIATYLNAVETEGKSVRTIKSYRDSLATFRLVGRRLGFPDAVEDHDVTHVYAFLAELRARRGRSGRATTTPIYQNHHHRTLGAFFSWCRRMGYLDPERTHVFARVPLARIERKAPRPFSEEEIERLLAGCDRSRMIGCRNYALLLFLLDNGVRSQECASVQLDEVDWERRRVLVHGKGAKQRWVGIGERTADALRDYVARFRGEQAGALFLGRHREGMADGHSFYVLLGRLAKRAGVEKANPHRFRYSFATWAIASGARELDVQLLLGHSSPQMTQHYARAYDSEQAVEAHAALSPVGQLTSTRGAAHAATSGRPRESVGHDLRSSLNGVSDVVRSEAAGALPDAPPARKEGRMSTTKAEINAGLTLVGKYKGEEHTCEVVEHDERLYFVRPDGHVLHKPLRCREGGDRHGNQRLPLLVGPREGPERPAGAPEGGSGGGRGRDPADQPMSTAAEADGDEGAAKPAKLIERTKSQKNVPEGKAHYFCSSCTKAFVAADAGRGRVPERCSGGATRPARRRRQARCPTPSAICAQSRSASAMARPFVSRPRRRGSYCRTTPAGASPSRARRRGASPKRSTVWRPDRPGNAEPPPWGGNIHPRDPD